MTAELPRCSLRSLAMDEPLSATASSVQSWLLLEQPGPWGAQALRDSRLPTGLGMRLARLRDDLGVRVLLVRRHGGASSMRRHCYLVSSRAQAQWTEHVRLDSAADVLDLDLAALARGERLGLEEVSVPGFLVCTHGRHDPCCAERGRPVAAALAAHYPKQTWEVSHIGGDRFAANLLVLPHGLYFGRLTPEAALSVAADYLGGTLGLPHYRGRSCYPFAVQAAETYLRDEQALAGLDDVRLLGSEQAGDTARVRFADNTGRTFLVRVRTRRAAASWRLSCHDAATTTPPAYELLELVKES